LKLLHSRVGFPQGLKPTRFDRSWKYGLRPVPFN
jgi:hypothetical protein